VRLQPNLVQMEFPLVRLQPYFVRMKFPLVLLQLNLVRIKKLYPTEKGKNIYPLLKREHDYSNAVALKGLSETEVESLFHLLQRVRKNVEKDWEYVKKGNKRNY